MQTFNGWLRRYHLKQISYGRPCPSNSCICSINLPSRSGFEDTGQAGCSSGTATAQCQTSIEMERLAPLRPPPSDRGHYLPIYIQRRQIHLLNPGGASIISVKVVTGPIMAQWASSRMFSISQPIWLSYSTTKTWRAASGQPSIYKSAINAAFRDIPHHLQTPIMDPANDEIAIEKNGQSRRAAL